MKSGKLKGIICGIVAAITYGTNPLGALHLYEDGINPNSVLFYRYSLAVIILGGLIFLQKKSFLISKKEISVLAVLGVIFAMSSITLFASFKYINAGIACTMLFIYPVMVALIMAIFFKEKITLITVLSIVLSLTGIGLLYKDDSGAALSTFGIVLIMLSSLAYSVYIVIVNKSSISVPPLRMTFYVMVFGTITILIYSFFTEPIQKLTTPEMWGWTLMLAILPTIVSLILMVIAVKELGSTPTAIMGALEPVTAVIIGIIIFHDPFTSRLALGILLILLGVTLIIAGKPLMHKVSQIITVRKKRKSSLHR